jgi:hypothetical protein
MIPRKSRRKQVPRPAPAADLELTFPDNDPELGPASGAPGPAGPAVCPCCGRPYFGPASSALLDLVVLTHENLDKIIAALETVVIP